MEFTVRQIAHLLGGEIKGNPDLLISSIAKIQEGFEGAISFLSNPKYETYIYETQASAVVVSKKFEAKKEISATLILVEDPYTAISSLLDEYNRMRKVQKTGIEQPCFISPNAQIGQNVYVGAFSYIGQNARIGNNVKIYPQCYIGDYASIDDDSILYAGVKIYAHSQIGKGCTLHSGVVIGSDGFGFAPQADGTYKNVPQVGNVILEDNVDIGANTVVDCATLGSTVIEKGVKLDNLIQIAHNVRIGENTVIAAQTGISGSSVIGKNCIIAGQVGIVGHLNIANRTMIAAQSGVTKDTKKEGIAIQGAPAFEHKESLKAYAVYKRLPELQKKIDQIEEKITELTKK